MQKWEYLKLKLTDTYPAGVLDTLGREGWEMVTIYCDWVYFKRQVSNA